MNRSDEHATHARRQPWWQDLRWITAGIFAVLLALLVWGLFGPEPPITVSRETTYLTEPLAADGLPDYEAALLAGYGPAPPPDDNAAVLLLQTCWPLGIDGAHLPAVCEALGIPCVPPPEALALDPTKDAAAGVTPEMLETAGQWPWTAEDLPEVAAWLAKHKAQIDRLVAAADRPRFWLPGSSLLDGTPDLLIEAMAPSMVEFRVSARVLCYRALWHVGENRPAAAWRDIIAIRRLARLLAPSGHGPYDLVTQLNAIAIDEKADGATRHLLALPDLPAEVLPAIRMDLEGFGPTVAISDGVAGERLYAIDAAVWLARRTPGGPRARMEFMDSEDWSLLTSLDWNLILERCHAHYHELDSACWLPTHQARAAAAGEIEGSWAWPRRSRWAVAWDVFLRACSRVNRSDRVADRLLGLFSPALSRVFEAAARGDAQFALTKTAAALAAWKADRAAGEEPYPETLDALVPEYLAAVPLDPFADKPFIYERRGDGYLLASVGSNGVYDGGNDWNGWIVGGEWQTTEQDVDYSKSDIVVRMPVPPPPAAAP